MLLIWQVPVTGSEQTWSTNPFESMFFRVLPIFVWFAGTFVWLSTLVYASLIGDVIRSVVSAMPIAGLSAIVLTPIVETGNGVLAAHCVLSVLFAAFVLKRNSTWFASHLQEL